ncbi:hypothetical protein SAMN05443287_105229 [Micromonospora phaseoli]|uniref:PE family protein n=1 Tax=Micromonospora phaseoli TaxID=1144548 RepID=A0A1H7A0I0_9ACTN|nr:hypothetical protein [Micromonospora phaseoli]PZV97076.1 hypothetical protein CLV64_106184 [Micromonospora phaseoli]GIJ77345.1 hypothetical protein Xph01_17770 [Micromonospora phaseoli]SEJ55502.1 hypothetical protein SAMN05443287_105229 [Micromonospora phaseoli]
MIPAEDRPASWLSSYGGVEADIRQLREFADKLRAEVESNYAPHLRYIADDMVTEVPNPADAFVELVQFMRAHWETQQAATNAVWGVGDATGHLAEAAKIVAEQYGDVDAFSAARVADIHQAFGQAGVVPAQPAPSPSLTDPTDSGTVGPVVLP